MVAVRIGGPSEAQKSRYEKLETIQKLLPVEGIDRAVPDPSTRERLDWAPRHLLVLTAVAEKQDRADLHGTAGKTRFHGKTTLNRNFHATSTTEPIGSRNKWWLVDKATSPCRLRHCFAEDFFQRVRTMLGQLGLIVLR